MWSVATYILYLTTAISSSQNKQTDAGDVIGSCLSILTYIRVFKEMFHYLSLPGFSLDSCWKPTRMSTSFRWSWRSTGKGWIFLSSSRGAQDLRSSTSATSSDRYGPNILLCVFRLWQSVLGFMQKRREGPKCEPPPPPPQFLCSITKPSASS